MLTFENGRVWRTVCTPCLKVNININIGVENMQEITFEANVNSYLHEFIVIIFNHK